MENPNNEELKKAVETLCNHLKADSDYFYSWQANIAVCFMDAFEPLKPLHTVANEGAKNFLNLLIR